MHTISESGKKPGSHAGTINIALNESNSTVTVTGTHQATLALKEKLRLLAVGSDGLDGKKGANGRDGAPGHAGHKATKYRRGSDGSPGENGEHGEAGTNGGPAGNGGNVDIWVKEEDLALFDVIFSINASAGRPGKPGEHGVGGRGGDGGRGGSAYTWTTTHTDSHTEHTIDSAGNSHARVVSTPHHIHHVSPGGANGPRGADGGTFTHKLYPGAAGRPGQVYFHVTGQNGELRHTEPYKLAAQNVSFQSREGSGLYEPGDTISACYQIDNTGETMPSPPESIPLIFENSEHLQLIQPGMVEGSIPAGKNHCSGPTSLEFFINEPQEHVESTPYKVVTTVRVAALNTRLNQPFQHSGTSNTLTIQYPVILQPQSPVFSIAEGESYPLQAIIENIGTKMLGHSDEREILVEVAAADTRAHLMSEYILSLAPSDKLALSHAVQFKAGSEPGDRQTYHINLFLQPISRADNLTLIQQQTITAQLTPKYFPTNNRFTLVINGNTTKDQLAYWTGFLSHLSGNSGVAIWNTAYYQTLNLDGDPCLLHDTRQGTIVILDDLFPSGREHNTQYITKGQLLKASQQYDVSLVAVGNRKLPTPYTQKEIAIWSDPIQEHSSLDQLMTTLLREDRPQVSHQLTIPLQQRWFYREKADEVLALVTERLNKVFPNRYYHVCIVHDDQQAPACFLPDGRLVRADQKQVTINVRRLADRSEQNIQQIALSDNELAHPVQHHETIQSGIIRGLSFSHKLDLFMQNSSPYHKELARTIIKDLLNEQNMLMQTEPCGSLLERIMRQKQHDFTVELKKLRQLVDTLEQFAHQGDFENTRTWSPLLINLIAQVQYHARQQSTFWTRFIHWFVPQTNEQIITSSNTLCDKILHLQSSDTKTPVKQLHTLVQREEDIIHLAEQLKLFLRQNDKNNDRAGFSFFNKAPISPMERRAAQQLLHVCLMDATPDTLNTYQQTMHQSANLKEFVAQFERLFPACAFKTEADYKLHYAFT